MSSPACKVTDITSLIPQRPPILMVDGYFFEDDLHCRSELTVAADNMFLGEGGCVAEEGLLEHVAQTSAAHIGHIRKMEGQSITLGYIGDIKRAVFTPPMPAAGDTLHTKLTVVSQVGNVTLVSAETSVDERVVLTCRMKLANENEGDAR
ncbi:MAG: hydroxymyristoyl-ACP dehydratase [Bacteroidales bacterium]|nr:hydroxymyristoyl-ACP dehydratase [Bacteroidales bacterium]